MHQCLEILGKVYAEKGDYKSAYTRFKDCLHLRKMQLDSKDPQLKRVQNLLLELKTKIAHDLTQTKQTQKTRETYEYITERLNQTLKGVKGLKMHSQNSINGIFHGSKFQPNGERQLLKGSRDNLFYHHSGNTKEPTTPPSEYNNESIDRYSDAGNNNFADSASHNDESRGRMISERSGVGALLAKTVGKFGAAREKDSIASSNYISDPAKSKTQTNPNNFQLRVDNTIVMGMASDQLMQMVQLQSRLRTVGSVEEAQRILVSSSFFRNLSLTDKVSFKASNPEYFKPLTAKTEAIFKTFIQKIANNDPSTDFRQAVKQKINTDNTDETEPGLHFRGSRSNALKPVGSKLKGTLQSDSFSGNFPMDEAENRSKSPQGGLRDKELLRHESLDGESTENWQTKRTNQSPEDGSRGNSPESSVNNGQIGKFKLQRQILQSVKANSLFKGGLQNLKAKLAEK